MLKSSLGCVALLAALVAPASAQQGPAKSPPLVIESQGSFFVGGRNVKSDTLSTLPAYAPSGPIAVEQVYVHYQVPVDAKRPPVVLIHGCCLTGKTWETTPDGRMGWDEYFVRKGYPTYVIDQVSRGRSAANPTLLNSVRLGQTPPAETPPVFAAGQEAAWAIFRFGPEYPKVFDGISKTAQGARVSTASLSLLPVAPPFATPYPVGRATFLILINASVRPPTRAALPRHTRARTRAALDRAELRA